MTRIAAGAAVSFLLLFLAGGGCSGDRKAPRFQPGDVVESKLGGRLLVLKAHCGPLTCEYSVRESRFNVAVVPEILLEPVDAAHHR